MIGGQFGKDGKRGGGTVAKTGPYSITAGDNGAVFSNKNATGIVPFTLPTYAENLTYSFYVEDEDGIRIISPDSQIRIISAEAPAMSCTTIGGYVTLKAFNGSWKATTSGGTWSGS